jgi:hypothetical protein
MRYFYLVAILTLAIFFGTCHAQDAQAPAKDESQPAVAKQYKEVPVDRNGDTKIDGVDVYDDQHRIVRKDYDDDGDGMNDRYLDYDPNTGMPMVTASDQEFGD